jgi:hypothetical protein
MLLKPVILARSKRVFAKQNGFENDEFTGESPLLFDITSIKLLCDGHVDLFFSHGN